MPKEARVIQLQEGLTASMEGEEKIQTLLCKWRGSLVLFEIKPIPHNPATGEVERNGQCPSCGASESFKLLDDGWITCTDCYEFAACKSQYDRLMGVTSG